MYVATFTSTSSDGSGGVYGMAMDNSESPSRNLSIHKLEFSPLSSSSSVTIALWRVINPVLGGSVYPGNPVRDIDLQSKYLSGSLASYSNLVSLGEYHIWGGQETLTIEFPSPLEFSYDPIGDNDPHSFAFWANKNGLDAMNIATNIWFEEF